MPNISKEEIEKLVREIMRNAYKFAQRAYQLYPENKHTFSDYWSGIAEKECEEHAKKILDYANQYRIAGLRWVIGKEHPKKDGFYLAEYANGTFGKCPFDSVAVDGIQFWDIVVVKWLDESETVNPSTSESIETIKSLLKIIESFGEKNGKSLMPDEKQIFLNAKKLIE